MAQVDRTASAGEHHRSRLQVLYRRVRVIVGVQRSFRDCDIACGRDEFGELGVRDLMSLDPEPVDGDGPSGPLVRIVLLGSQHGGLLRDPDEFIGH